MSSQNKTKLLEFSRHPILILALTSFVGSMLVPWISGRIDAREKLEKERSASALAVLKKNRNVLIQLNQMKTTLAVFHKRSKNLGDQADENARTNAMKKADLEYEKFQELAWWWYWEEYEKASALKLLPQKDFPEQKKNIEAYDKALRMAVQLYFEFRKELFSIDYNPNDPSIQETMKRTHRESNKLMNQLNKIATIMSAPFLAAIEADR